MASISVVIPTWNRRDLVAACLASIDKQSVFPNEIVVVDDGSTDDTVDWIAANYPGVLIVTLPENQGFCGAINAGIRAAQGNLLLLLNNDMTLDSRFIEYLLDACDHSDASLFAPLVLSSASPEIVYSAGDRQRRNGRPEPIGFLQPVKGFTMPHTIFGVSAGAGLYRRTVFDTVGLFDERFVAYFEDSDLNFRARLAGFRADLVPQAIAYHVGSASIEGRTWWRTRQCFRNHLLLVVKNMPAPLLFKHAPMIVRERLHQARRLLSAARADFGLLGALSILVGAVALTVRALPHAFRERRRIQSIRMVAPKDLNELLSS